MDPIDVLADAVSRITHLQGLQHDLMVHLAQVGLQPPAPPAPAPPPPAPNAFAQVLKSVKLPEFSGERAEEELEAWVFRCEGYFDTVPNITEEQKVQLACLLLKGRAALWWREVKQKPPAERPATWQDFVRELKRLFLPLDAVHMAWEKLARARQRDRESVSAYTAYMRSIFFHIPAAHITEAHKLDAYVRGLLPHLREKVYVAEPASFEAAAALAAKHEALRSVVNRTSQLPRNFGPPGPGPSARTAPPSYGPRPMELGAMTGTGQRPASNRSPITCWRCGQPGHTKRECTLPQPGNGPSRRPPARAAAARRQ